MRIAGLLVLGFSSVAWAEVGWLATRGRLVPGTRIEAFVGTATFGAGVLRTADKHARFGVMGEAVVGYVARTVELRGGAVWQLTESRFATLGVSLGGSAFVVPDRALDLGVGPHGEFVLSLGGRTFFIDLSAQTGAEVFVRQPLLRFPQRLGLAATLRIGDFTVALMSRVGVDVVLAAQFVGRAEAMLSVGWLGFGQPADSGT